MPSAANWIPSPTPDRLLTNPLGEGVVVDLAKRLREANRQLHELYSNPSDTLRLLEQAALDIQQTISA